MIKINRNWAIDNKLFIPGWIVHIGCRFMNTFPSSLNSYGYIEGDYLRCKQCKKRSSKDARLKYKFITGI